MSRPVPWLSPLVLLVAAACTGAPQTPEDKRVAECEATREANESLADSGEVEATFKMGQLYDVGCGVPHRPAYAYLNYLYAAERGHAEAAFRVGGFYLGKGSVRRSWERALFWFAVAERNPALSPQDRRYIQTTRASYLNQTLGRGGGDRLKHAEEKAAAWVPRTD